MLQRGDTLKEQAFALIREKILRQELPMGSHLNIAAMSRELKISNSPLRESIALLEQEGLVESTSNAGFRIVKLDAQKMTQLTQAFLVLLEGC